MKRLIASGLILFLFTGCQQETLTGVVGQQFLLKADIPDEIGTFDYIWKITNLPETSQIALADIQFSEDESQAIFVPDVAGHYSFQATVWKYNDKLGSVVYSYDITHTAPVVEAQQVSKDEWLNETVEETMPVETDKVTDEIDSVTEEKVQDVKEPMDDAAAEVESIVEDKIEETSVEMPVKSVEPDMAIYTIQVAAESNKETATNTINRLRAAGFDSYLQEHRTSSGLLLYRIRVGKFADRESALTIAGKLEQERGLSTWVTTYQK